MSIYQPSPVAETALITISTASITLDLENNTIYNFTNAAITEIDLSAATGLKYCGFEFESSSTAPTFSYPADGSNDWILKELIAPTACLYPPDSLVIEAGMGYPLQTTEKPEYDPENQWVTESYKLEEGVIIEVWTVHTREPDPEPEPEPETSDSSSSDSGSTSEQSEATE